MKHTTHSALAGFLCKASITGFIALMLTACSLFSSDSSGPKPSPLLAFTQKVSVGELWSTQVGNGQGNIWLGIHPAVSGDTIYAASHSGEVVAINRITGKKQWQISLNKPVTAGVSTGHGLVLTGTSKGALIALDALSGKRKWTADASGEILSAPAIAGNVVVTQTVNGKVTAFDAESGKQLWQQTSILPVLLLRGNASPVISGNLVFTGFSSGNLNAWDLYTGKEIWQNTVALPEGSSELKRMVDVDATPLLVGKKIYVISYQGKMKAINASNGQTLWSRKASGYQGMTASTDSLYITNSSDEVSAIDESSGGNSWTQKKLTHRQLTAPVAIGNYIVTGDFDGYLHVLSQTDGSIVGRYKTGSSGIRVQPIIKGNTIYIFSNSGKLAALTIN